MPRDSSVLEKPRSSGLLVESGCGWAVSKMRSALMESDAATTPRRIAYRIQTLRIEVKKFRVRWVGMPRQNMLNA